MKKSFTASKGIGVLGVLGACLAVSSSSFASVKTVGDWPKDERRVTVTIDAPRAEAVKKLAEASGWNIVVPDKLGGGAEALHVAVKDESPLAVLEALLESGDFTATRHGKLVVVSNSADVASTAASAAPSMPVAAPTPPTPPTPPSPPSPPADAAKDPHPKGITVNISADDEDEREEREEREREAHEDEGEAGEDKSVMGGNATVAKGERVHDVSVMGGNLDIEGVVTGDVSVMGGKVRVRDGAHVKGDAVAVGGTLDVDKGARVDGDVGVVGGVLHRHAGAIIRGKTIQSGGKVDDADSGDESSPKAADGHGNIKLQHKLSGVGSSIAGSAMLFVFGVVLLSFLRNRYDVIKVDLASRPVKAFATGIVATLLAVIATVVLSITVIGIPLVVVGWLFAALCAYGGIISVLTLVGELMLRHKTQNPYAHLAAGCALYMVLGAIPVVGGIVTGALLLVSVGVVVRTRAGGLFAKEVRVPA